jgi:myosin-crossreactive antigen
LTVDKGGVGEVAILADTELKKLIEGLRTRMKSQQTGSAWSSDLSVPMSDVTDLCDTAEAMQLEAGHDHPIYCQCRLCSKQRRVISSETQSELAKKEEKDED